MNHLSNNSSNPDDGIEAQRSVFERNFGRDPGDFAFHDTKNLVVRYLRDRRLNKVMERLQHYLGQDLSQVSALCVCGGVGGEATYLRNAGIGEVTNTDFSENALGVCRARDPRLKTRLLNAETMDLENESFDVVLVQDGLHHLPRPVLGFNEMLRVARKAVIVLEPQSGWSGRILGREWEEHEGTFNYVFRWNADLLKSATRSQLLKRDLAFEVIRLWDHSGCVHRAVYPLGNGKLSLLAAKSIYAALTPLNFLGNQFIGMVFKG
jgi:SAM-dependent methyltransferase